MAEVNPQGLLHLQRRPMNLGLNKKKNYYFKISISFHLIQYIRYIFSHLHSKVTAYCQVHISNERVTVLKTFYPIRIVSLYQDPPGGLINWLGLHELGRRLSYVSWYERVKGELTNHSLILSGWDIKKRFYAFGKS